MELTIYTQNIWFSPLHREERTYALIEFILLNKPDIVCLQEVTPPVRDIILSNNNITQIYTWDDDEFGGYGVAIMSKLEVDDVIILPLLSTMGRNLLTVQLDNSVIGTVHLESLNNEQIRLIQLNNIITQMQDVPVFILAGDFNMKSNEQPVLPPEYTMYNQFLTYDGADNKMINSTRYAPQPFDRFLVKGCTLKSIQRVNDQPFKDNIYISDHYGLYATFIVS